MHRGRTPRRLLIAGVTTTLVATLAGLGPQAGAASYPGSNGPLLISAGRLLWPDGTSKLLGFSTDRAKFSPDGGTLAYAQNAVDGDGMPTSGHVLVRRHGSAATEVASFAQGVGELSWSPDGKALAVQTHLMTSGTVAESALHRVPLDGSGPQVLASDDSGRAIEGADWSPDGSRIAYVRMGSDIFTVPAAGGTPTNVTSRCTYPAGSWVADCAAAKEDLTYAGLDWAPDASRWSVSTTVSSPNGSELSYVGVLTPGSTIPTEVYRLTVVDESPSSGSSVWAPDGTKLAVADQTSAGASVVRVIRLSDKAEVQTYPTRVLQDWQPCPSGTCAPWTRTTTTKTRYALSLNIAKAARIKAYGAVSPRATGTVRVRLQVSRNGAWVNLRTKDVRLTATSRYRAYFSRPARRWCKVVATSRSANWPRRAKTFRC